MRRAALALSLLAWTACQSLAPAARLPAGDPRPQALLDAWRTQAAGRDALSANARLAVDAPGAGPGGGGLSLRSRQRLWLARPASLRVEVLGFLGTAAAVLTTDGERYAWLQSDGPRFDSGVVYDGLLWDAARLDLTPAEAVEVMLGAPRPDADLGVRAAWSVAGLVRIELEDAQGRLRRVVEFDAQGELRRIEQRDAAGATAWQARFGDYVDLAGGRFARDVAVESGEGATRAALALREVELNPLLPPGLFRLQAPPGAAIGAEGG